MKVIGGYFEEERLILASSDNQYHDDSYHLNSCRNALLLIIIKREYSTVYIPYFTCNVVAQVLKSNNVKVEYYHINQHLEPLISDIPADAGLIYTNYFGLKDEYIQQILKKYKNLIIDNAQSFYSKSIPGVDTVYSPRKFFGLPDGGLLSTDLMIDLTEYSQDHSQDRCSHLILRKKYGAEKGYSEFLKNDAKLINLPIMEMSNYTKSAMGKIDYEGSKKKRKENFNYLHNKLNHLNEFEIPLNDNNSPLVYPLLVSNGDQLKSHLISMKIFVATYWPEVKSLVNKDCYEYYLTNNLINIPIDQRYNIEDMKLIVKKILNYG